MFLRDIRGSYNIISFLAIFPLVLFLVLFLIGVQQDFYVRNNINDIASTCLDIALTSGGLCEDVWEYIDQVVADRGFDADKVTVRASSTDPDCPNAVVSGDVFVKRGNVITLEVGYKFDSMVNALLGISGDRGYKAKVYGMSQRWHKAENELGE